MVSYSTENQRIEQTRMAQFVRPLCVVALLILALFTNYKKS